MDAEKERQIANEIIRLCAGRDMFNPRSLVLEDISKVIQRYGDEQWNAAIDAVKDVYFRGALWSKTKMRNEIESLRRNTIAGIPIETDPNLKPGQWQLRCRKGSQ